MHSLVTHSEKETFDLGFRIGKTLFPGAFVALWGELGAGKTSFAKGVAMALGIKGVVSPTFVIFNQYEGRLPLYHFDCYRLSGGDELLDIGADEIFSAGGVTLLEWPGQVEEELPEKRLDVFFEYAGEDERVIRIRALSKEYEDAQKAVGP